MTGIAAKPEMEFKAGAVRAAIWMNPHQSADGKSFTSAKVVVERIYKDESGHFKSTHRLDINDIPKAILLLKKAYEVLTLKKPELDHPPIQSHFKPAIPNRLP